MTEPGRWGEARVVAGFERASANAVLLDLVRTEIERQPALRVLDLGCGAARNAAPMAALGATVIGVDVVRAMLDAARRRLASAEAGARVFLVRAPMDRLPVADASVDLVVAHGIWNLALSGDEFRRALGEAFVFTQFSGEPQCFLTEAELNEELRHAGFERDAPGPLTEYNRPVPGRTLTRGGPVIYEGTYRRRPDTG